MASFLRTRTTLTMGGSGAKCLSQYYWDATGASMAVLVTEAHARVRAFWAALANAIPSSSLLSFEPLADEIEESTGQILGQHAGTLPSVVTFTNANEPLPFQTQGLIRFDTGTYVAGRRLKGRMFVPGASEDRNVSGFPLTAYVTQMQTAANALGTTIVDPMAQRVWHRPGPSGVGGLTVPVMSRVASAQWHVLKSRRS